jgi:hypothetical protein
MCGLAPQRCTLVIVFCCLLMSAACGGPERSGEDETNTKSPVAEKAGSAEGSGPAQVQPPEPEPGMRIQGTIVGIGAKAPFAELTSGKDIQSLAFNGTLTVELPGGAKVTAACAENLISNVIGCPHFNKRPDQIGGGFVADITISATAGQKVTLVANDSHQWQVAEVLKEEVRNK